MTLASTTERAIARATPIAVPAKLCPFIVLSTAEEIDLTRSALVIPTSRWGTLDFRWTYRLTRELLARAQRRAPAGYPRGPIARLRAEDMAALLERFRAYLS